MTKVYIITRDDEFEIHLEHATLDYEKAKKLKKDYEHDFSDQRIRIETVDIV